MMLIYDRGRLGRSAAAAAFKVSVRTISRCTDLLLAAGAPILGRKGPSGGWDLEPLYRAKLSQFERPIVEARLEYALACDKGRDGFEAAVAQPGPPGLPTRASAKASRHSASAPLLMIDPSGWGASDWPGASVALLEQAIAERYVLSFTASGRSWRFHPTALAWKAREFYLIGQSAGEDHVFSVLNISDLAVLEERFERPAAASVASLWLEAQVAATQAIGVRLRIHMQAVPELTRRHSPGRPPTLPALRDALLAPNRPGPDGWYTAAFEVDDIDYLILALWSVVGDVEVLAPPELARRLSLFATRQKTGR